MKGLTEGRIVHYVLPDGPRIGEHRAATVTRVYDAEQGVVSLCVAMDGPRDYAPLIGTNPFGTKPSMMAYVPDVTFDEAKAKGTWHWIEQA